MRNIIYPAAAIAAVMGLVTPAWAARPMITDDARIVDAKSCQLESWVKNNRQGGTEYWALPACNFTGNLEFTVGGALTDDAASHQISDQVVQIKTLFRTLQPGGWGAGLASGINRHPELPGGNDWYAYVPISFSFGNDALVLHTNTGWKKDQISRRAAFTWGLGSELAINKRNWLIAETFGNSESRPYYQLGIRHWIVPNRVQIDATLGNRLGTGAGDAEQWLSIGLRLLSLPFLP